MSCSAAEPVACHPAKPPASPAAGRAAAAVPSRRSLLLVGVSWVAALPAGHSQAAIRLDLAPPPLPPPGADAALDEVQLLFSRALSAPSLEEEERRWSQLVALLRRSNESWQKPLLGGVLANRGNARSRGGRLAEALIDYDEAALLAPWSVDAVLNRGVVLEQLGRFDEAVAAYDAVLAASPDDPAGWNNRGNANIGKRDYAAAVADLSHAVALSPQYAGAACNLAVARYANGERKEAMRSMRALLRRYPNFDDVRAALAAALWIEGDRSAAEGEWSRVDDARYKSADWLRTDRRWPPPLADALVALLQIDGGAAPL